MESVIDDVRGVLLDGARRLLPKRCDPIVGVVSASDVRSPVLDRLREPGREGVLVLEPVVGVFVMELRAGGLPPRTDCENPAPGVARPGVWVAFC